MAWATVPYNRPRRAQPAGHGGPCFAAIDTGCICGEDERRALRLEAAEMRAAAELSHPAGILRQAS